MNRTFIILLLFVNLILLDTIWATNHYVDKDATGNNNGLSWQDAWQNFSDIIWSAIQPGDTIYISGGSVSKTYSNVDFNVGASGTSGNSIVITKGINSGHNGEVIFNGNNSVSNNISIQSRNYVTIQYLSIREAGTGGGNIDIDNCTGIIIDSLDILADSRHGGVNIKTSSECHIQRCYFTTPSNSSRQTDGIYSQDNVGKNYYHDNHIVISNRKSSSHCDGIQSYKDKDLDIYNNYVEQDNSKSSNAQGIYLTTPINGSTIRFWNNIVNHGQSNSNGLAVRNLGSTGITVLMIGNTVYGETGSDHSIWMTEMTSAPTVKNNIIHFVGTTGTGISITGAGYNNTSYNLQSNTANVRGTNAITSNPLFTNPSNRDFTLLAGSPAIDAGTTLNSPYDVDIHGVSRPQGGAWDMGVYENYSGPDVTPPQLQGAVINSPTQVTLTFSESLDAQSVQNASNYSIDNSISVISAALSSNNRDVTLTTSEHIPGDYTITIINVLDTAGNVIDPNFNTTNYTMEAPPPVEMLYFIATLDGNVVTLVWETLSENGNLGWDIEESRRNRNNFTKIWFVAGSGDSNVPLTYTFNTSLSNYGKYYYRLKQMSLDESFSYSENVLVDYKRSRNSALTSYPNPFNPQTTVILYMEKKEAITINVYNMLGQHVATLFDGIADEGEMELTFNGQRLSSGTYVVAMQVGTSILNHKILLLK